MTSKFYVAVAALGLGLGLAACAVGPDYKRPALDVPAVPEADIQRALKASH